MLLAMRVFFSLIFMSFALSACSSFFEKDTEIKSPCVAINPMVTDEKGTEHQQHPCVRRPANANWLG